MENNTGLIIPEDEMGKEYELTYEMLNNALIRKIRALTAMRETKPQLLKKYLHATRQPKAEYKRLWLLAKLQDPKLTSWDLKVLVEGDEAYHEVWSKEIMAQAEYEKCKVEISNLEDELETLREMGNNLARELKANGTTR